jgi:hypothetical protein
MARTGLRMMPTFPSSPLRFRTAGFPRYGSKAGLSDRAFPNRAVVKLAPSIPVARSGLPPSFVLSATAWTLRTESESSARWSTAMQATNVALPQGPSLRTRLCCPGPSSLSRPHPPRSQAHRNFAAWRLIRDAFAVRERLGDPRVVPGFRCTFYPDMPSSKTPGNRHRSVPASGVDIGLRRGITGSAFPGFPQSVSRGATISGLPDSHICYGLPVCSPP